MRDFSTVHKGVWLEDISKGETPNMVTITVRTVDGGKARFRLATTSLLDRIRKVEAGHKRVKSRQGL